MSKPTAEEINTLITVVETVAKPVVTEQEKILAAETLYSLIRRAARQVIEEEMGIPA
jgi:hypothetical protein